MPASTSPIPSKIHTSLLATAQSLCNAFSSKSPLPHLLSHFSTTTSPTALEHGSPNLGPFLGRPFTGTTGVEEYFKLLQQCLSFEDMSFSEYVVDETARKVCVKGEATFTWLETAVSWREVFFYVLDLVEEGEGECKVQRYQVWADSGALYLASQGKWV